MLPMNHAPPTTDRLQQDLPEQADSQSKEQRRKEEPPLRTVFFCDVEKQGVRHEMGGKPAILKAGEKRRGYPGIAASSNNCLRNRIRSIFAGHDLHKTRQVA